jgi:hypothetical protein
LLVTLTLSSCGTPRALRSSDGYRWSPIGEMVQQDEEHDGDEEPRFTLCVMADDHLPKPWSARMTGASFGLASPEEMGSLDDLIPESSEMAMDFRLDCRAEGPQIANLNGMSEQVRSGLATELEGRLIAAGFSVEREDDTPPNNVTMTYRRPGGIEGILFLDVGSPWVPPTATPRPKPSDAGQAYPPPVRSSLGLQPEPSLEFQFQIYEGTWDYAGTSN